MNYMYHIWFKLFQADNNPSLLDDFDPFSSLTSPSQSANNADDPFAAFSTPASTDAGASKSSLTNNDDIFGGSAALSTDNPTNAASQQAEDPFNFAQQSSNDPFTFSNDDDPFNINQPSATSPTNAAAALSTANDDPFGLGFSSGQPMTSSDPFSMDNEEGTAETKVSSTEQQNAFEAQFDALMTDDSPQPTATSETNDVTADEVRFCLPFHPNYPVSTPLPLFLPLNVQVRLYPNVAEFCA